MIDLTPTDTVLRFVGCVNRGEIDGGVDDLLADDHVLSIGGAPDAVGRDTVLAGWRSYADAFPDYVIHVRSIDERDGLVIVAGHTTGSHLGIPDDLERTMPMLWTARVVDGRLTTWTVDDDTSAARARRGAI